MLIKPDICKYVNRESGVRCKGKYNQVFKSVGSCEKPAHRVDFYHTPLVQNENCLNKKHDLPIFYTTA